MYIQKAFLGGPSSLFIHNYIVMLIPSAGAKRRPRAEGPRARVLISTGV